MWRRYTVLCFGKSFFSSLIFVFYGVYKNHYDPIVLDRQRPIIADFAFGDLDKLLFHYSEKNPPIEEQLYLFMKRFRTQPSEFFLLDKKMRLDIFHREWHLVKKEYDEHDKLKNKTT